MIRTRRIYERPDASASLRVLVDRLWPRGLRKEAAQVDSWLRDIAPSSELRSWFRHDPSKWEEFQRRYFLDLDAKEALWRPLLERARAGDVTLLYGAADTRHNNAVALKAYLEVKQWG